MTNAIRPATRMSPAKRDGIFDAAREVFLRDGYSGASMDDIAARSHVSKQTVYKHFGSKEALFVEIVSSMTAQAGDGVHIEPAVSDADEATKYLSDYAMRQLTAVLTPTLVQMRRLVIGEAGRFPDLARVLYEQGPQRALASMTAAFARLDTDGVLHVPDPALAAEQFNWLVMSGPVNRAMLLGDSAIPPRRELQRHADATARLMVAAYR